MLQVLELLESPAQHLLSVFATQTAYGLPCGRTGRPPTTYWENI